MLLLLGSEIIAQKKSQVYLEENRALELLLHTATEKFIRNQIPESYQNYQDVIKNVQLDSQANPMVMKFASYSMEDMKKLEKIFLLFREKNLLSKMIR